MELVILIVVFGLLFDYTNGFHDAANVVATSIATKALAPISAIILAGVLNFVGATRISGVAQTIATGLVDTHYVSQLMVLCAVIGAIVWNFATWYLGIPSSSSYALIGGLLGASLTYHGIESVLWYNIVTKVLLPMFFSPLIGFGIGWVLMRILFIFISKRPSLQDQKTFQHLQIASACFVALSHGLNDAQKSMGLITLGLFSGGYLASPSIPLWVILSCAVVMGLGTASGGFRIIKTMAFSITKITSVQGFAAETSASCVILAASFMGMPVSSTHVITGGITGVGAAKSTQAVRWNVAKRLVTAWVLTLPGAALVSALIYWALRVWDR